MNRNKIIAALMAVIMVLSMLPAMVFAEGGTVLDGKLKIKGQIVVGNELSADYGKVIPEGITDDDVSFSWSRLIAEGQEPVLLSAERTYKVTEEDLGHKLVLTVTGLAERGFSGSLKVTSSYGAVATADEAAAAETSLTASEQPAEEIPVENDQPDENRDGNGQQEEIPEELPEENLPDVPDQESTDGELYIEDIPEGDISAEEIPDYDNNTEPDTDDTLFDENNVQEESFPVSPDGYDAEPVADYTYDAVAIAESAAEDGTAAVDFGTIIEGTEDEVQEKYVTIKNTGTGTLNFGGISPEHFEVGDVNAPLESGEEVSLYIKPRSGVPAGVYTNDEIVYKTDEGVSVKILANLTVEQAPADTEFGFSEDDELIPDPDNGEDLIPIPEGPSDTPEEEHKTITAGDGVNSYSFGTVEEGYEQPVAAGITLQNNGDVDVTLELPVSGLGEDESAFIIQGYTDITDNVLPAGGTTIFSIQPKAGLAAGIYTETLYIYEANADNGEALMTFDVSFTVNEKTEEPDPAVTLTPRDGTLDFGAVKEGYAEAPAAQEITITNAGNVTITLEQPTAANFDLGVLSSTVLEPGESAVMAVRPKIGLTESAYTENIEIKNDAELALGITAMISVSAPELSPTATPTPVPVHKVISVQNPQNIAGVSNAAEKSAKGLGLPSAVVITTNRGDMKAVVSWDVKNCKYDPKATDSQSFPVSGQVILPDGVQNPDGVSLSVSVNVSVNAYSPKLANASNNMITGISSDKSYDTLSRISFTAVGAGMDNSRPRRGDTRYLPLYWKVINTNRWNGAPYSAAFGMAQKGQYTLSVVFDQQTYDGSSWANTGKQDTKSVVFNVVAAKATEVPGQTLTPAAQKTDANQKKAVRTGDNTQILPYILVLAVAIVAAGGAGVVIYRRKKK